MFFKVKENGQNICPGRIGSANLTALRGKQSALFADRSAPSQGSIPLPFFPHKKTALQADFFMVELRGIEPLTS